MTTTPMKRAGQLVAHLDTLLQIRDARQLMLLQLSMRERQDQVALFKRQGEGVTLSLIGAQLAAPTSELTHRAGTASASALLEQLQGISGIRGDDVAFSSGQIAEMITAQTRQIEASDGLARLDAALLALVGRLEQEVQAETEPVSTPDEGSRAQEAAAEVAQEEVVPEEGISPADKETAAEPDASFSQGRSTRRRSA
ncbi:hypothetical protein Q0M94_03125 [Deinococcus radiomollis]|uniref:hypothetical protein n=1 Tax=Deinococcus radiomollis TaxID=468916 RepID=UPI0038913D21